MIGLLFVYL